MSLAGAGFLVALGAAVACAGPVFCPPRLKDAAGAPPSLVAFAAVVISGLAMAAAGLWLAFFEA
ncbi:MAG TPA: hypothetical protein VK009_12320 [Chloroflexota bacterium]|nr:hypothetical protein [Chloroflexota bacterium]